MSVQRVVLADGTVSWRVRWRDGGRDSRMNSRSFARKADAVAFDDELRRRRRLGEMGAVVGSRDTLDHYVAETWAKTHAVTLARSTARTYAGLYDLHIAPYLGQLKLVELTPEVIARWQAERIAAGAGRSSIHKTLTLLGGILQRAMESGRINRNPVRLVRKVKRPKKKEVRPLAPETVEALRAACGPRDATLISVLAYSGLRPQEALALRWGDVRERTILVERALSLGEEAVGEEADTKTTEHRTVRLLAPLRGPVGLEAALGPAARVGGDLSGPGGAVVVEAELRQLARPELRPRDGAGRRGGLDAVRAAAQLRLAAVARGPIGDLRRAPARARRSADVGHVRARDRRVGGRAADPGGRRDPGRPGHTVCHWCAI
jgi:integrase